MLSSVVAPLIAIMIRVPVPVGMISFPAVKTANDDGRSNNPDSTGPVDILPATDPDVFISVPGVILRSVSRWERSDRLGNNWGRSDRRDADGLRWIWLNRNWRRRWRSVASR